METEDKEKEWKVNKSVIDYEAEEEVLNIWAVPYGDLMTNLMIFFMVLYSFAYIGQSTKYEKMIANIQGQMGDAGAKQKSDEINVAEKISDYIDKSGLKNYASVAVSAQNIKITLSNPVLFDSGSADIKPSAYPTLDEISGFLKTIPNPVAIEGHTDNIPIYTAKFRSNFELSAARAFSVIDYFANTGKIRKERFSCLGYGEFMPVSANETEEGRAKNRRIEINIIREEK